MKTDRSSEEKELRSEYRRSDFPNGFVRGKYAQRLKESSNIIVLKPEVAKVFPNEEAVNDALLSLIDLAKRTVGPRCSAASANKRISR
ncbi:hypothetical protein [Desulfatirhabdium butyrativorans]|uniref:hypothetical protein n=1 Tax=Desulfatirhabdium butyrativorans TaxID=340467 RepID=UPI000429A344|nr:hypothetical protein [Desulfatirhabdium butyrativorans]